MGGLAVTAILSLCLAASGQVGQLPVVSTPGDGLPVLIATRQMLFFIPFGIDEVNKLPQAFGQMGSEHKGAKPTNHGLLVQLWVSQDRGQSWQFCAAMPSSRRGFLFRAKHDGEYWFLVRTVDPSGTARDEHGSVTELRVLVDTQPPTLYLDAWCGKSGQVCSRWAIDETYLKPGSLEMLYRTGPRQPWRPLAIDRQASGCGRVGNERSQRDHGPWMVNWCPNADAKFVQIRAKVVDMAGNTTISHAHVDMVEQPQNSPGNIGYPNTTVGPIATKFKGISGWPAGGPNRLLTR